MILSIKAIFYNFSYLIQLILILRIFSIYSFTITLAYLGIFRHFCHFSKVSTSISQHLGRCQHSKPNSSNGDSGWLGMWISSQLNIWLDFLLSSLPSPKASLGITWLLASEGFGNTCNIGLGTSKSVFGHLVCIRMGRALGAASWLGLSAARTLLEGDHGVLIPSPFSPAALTASDGAQIRQANFIQPRENFSHGQAGQVPQGDFNLSLSKVRCRVRQMLC